VDITLLILSASIAVEVSEFFMEKVPPNPQQTSASGRSMRVRASTALRRR
jgi:hypothetical protein